MFGNIWAAVLKVLFTVPAPFAAKIYVIGALNILAEVHGNHT